MRKGAKVATLKRINGIRNHGVKRQDKPMLAIQIMIAPCTCISCINLHQSASAGLRGLATIGLDVVAGGLGIAASVVRALEVSTARVRVEGFCTFRSPWESKEYRSNKGVRFDSLSTIRLTGISRDANKTMPHKVK